MNITLKPEQEQFIHNQLADILHLVKGDSINRK